MALDQLYQQTILEHNRKPRNYGHLTGATHAARGHDAMCGDDILMELIVEDGCIRQAAFSGDACAVTKATASMLTDWLPGRQASDIADWSNQFQALLKDHTLPDAPELADLNQLRPVSQFPARVRNALLPWTTTLRALNQPEGTNP